MEFSIKMNRLEFASFVLLVRSCVTMNIMDVEMGEDKSAKGLSERAYYDSVLFDLVVKLAKKAHAMKDKNKLTLNGSESFVIFNMFSRYPLGSIGGLELAVLLEVRDGLHKWYMVKESEIKNRVHYELQQS